MAEGTNYGGRAVVSANFDFVGQGCLNDPSDFLPGDSCEFLRWTGYPATTFGVVTVPAFPDIQFTAGTTVLVAAAATNNGPATGLIGGVPRGMKCYITSLQVQASTAFSGGTAGTVSVSFQDTAGTVIASFTQAALTSGVYISLPVGSLPSGVVDNLISLMGPCTAVNQGIQVVTSNSTAGVLRVRLRGFYAP